MKEKFSPYLIIVILMLLAAARTHARIDETEAQIEARYGKATMVMPDQQFAVTKQYSFNGYTITVSFKGGMSQFELYEKIDKSEITSVERYGLMLRNFAGLPCDEYKGADSSKLVFKSPDGRKRVAICDLVSNTVTVSTKDFMERAAAHANDVDAKKLSGF